MEKNMKRPLTNMTIKEKAEEIFKETEHLKELLDEDKAAYDASFKDEKPYHVNGECTSSCRRVGCPETNND